MVTDPLVPDCVLDIGFLAVGDSVTYTCDDLNVTSSYTNEACVSGLGAEQVVTDCDPSTVVVRELEREGCTPGYWKQDQHFDSWEATGYEPGDSFDVVFGVASSNGWTLLEALDAGGGDENALARHATAALLNARPCGGCFATVGSSQKVSEEIHRKGARGGWDVAAGGS